MQRSIATHTDTHGALEQRPLGCPTTIDVCASVTLVAARTRPKTATQKKTKGKIERHPVQCPSRLITGYLFNEPIGRDKQSADRTLPVAADMENNANVGAHDLMVTSQSDTLTHIECVA